MTRRITPQMVENIYMSIFSAEEDGFSVSVERSDHYAASIKTLTASHDDKSRRIDALISKLDTARCISLFVLPAKPWSVPATLLWQYEAGFDQYFTEMVSDFEIQHIIFGNGTKYSYDPKDDTDVSVFLERKRQ